MVQTMKKIIFLVPQGVNLAGLEQARLGLAEACAYHEQQSRPPPFEVALAGASRDILAGSGHYTIHPDYLLAEIPPADLYIVPPADPSADALRNNAQLVAWIGSQFAKGAPLAGLCMGSALLAAAGILDGLRAVTHWQALEGMQKAFPKVRWDAEKTLDFDGGIFTSGGAVSASRLILHLIEMHSDKATAIYCAKVFQLDYERHSQLPFSIFNGWKDHGDPVIMPVQSFLERHYSERITVEQICNSFAMGRRTLERRFRKATGQSVLEYQQRVRVEAAKRQLEMTSSTISDVMYGVGYNDAKAFRDTFRKYCGLSPLAYRERYQ